tara:strand:+ start:4997 stop:7012 length:2016 start_codon:yes stop_codon:yes gene_type:complete
MQNITTELPIIYSILCLLMGVIYSYFLYNKHTFEGKSWLPKLMAFLRFIVIFILTFFFLEPFVSSLMIDKEKPIIVVGVDQSESIQGEAQLPDLQAGIKELQNNLADDYQVDLYGVGTNTTLLDSFQYEDKTSNYSSFFQQLSDVYSHRNVAAVIFASDGLYNQGSNPLYADYPFQAPLYTIALGDTTPQKDIRISKLYHNDLVFLGNSFPLKISVQTQFCAGEKVNLTVWKEQNLLYQETLLVSEANQRFQTDVLLSADEVGMHRYQVRLFSLNGEKNTYNNTEDFFVEILESRQKILLLTESVHPDIFALTTAIEQNDNYEVHQHFVKEFKGDYSSYSLLIAFHTEVNEAPLPIWYVWGANATTQQTDWMQLNAYEGISSEVLVNSEEFSYFQMDEEWDAWAQQLPPLVVPFADINYLMDYQNVFSQKEKGIATNRPILSFHKGQEHRQALWLGEGLWKWRLFEYAQNESHELLDGLIQQCVQFLAVKEDKRLFRVNLPKKIHEHEDLSISAQLYDANYELFNDPDVTISLRNSEGYEFAFTLNKTVQSYELVISDLEEGQYHYESKVISSGEEHVRTGHFTVIPLQLEQRQKQANHQLLYKLANMHEGTLFYVSEIDDIQQSINRLETKTISYSRVHLSELLNQRWIFILLLVFLSLEWFLRKRNGSI